METLGVCWVVVWSFLVPKNGKFVTLSMCMCGKVCVDQ